MLRSASVLTLFLAASVAHAQPASGAGQEGQTAQISQSDVELLTPGRSPQRPLRHRFTAGQTGQYRLRINMQMRVQAGSRDQSVDMPVLLLDVDLGRSAVAGGNMRIPFRLVAVDLEGGDERARGPLQEQLSALVNTGGSAVVDPRGRLTRFDYDLPESATPEVRARAATLRDALGQLFPRFPREPVGLGATWRILDQMSVPGMQVQIATVYRLRRWDGDRIELQVRVESGSEPATEAVDVEIEGSGRTRFVLGSLQSRSRLQSRAQVAAQGPNGQLRIRMSTRNEVEPR